MGIIQKTSLDAFYLTQLELEPQKDTIWNSATNFTLAPLQYLVGQQNKYKSLEGGKVSPVPSEASSPETFLLIIAIKKVALFVVACIFTPVGTVTRAASLYVSSDVAEAYSVVRILKLTEKFTEAEFDALQSELTPDLFKRVKDTRSRLSSLISRSTDTRLVKDQSTALAHPAAPIEPRVEPRKDSSLGNDEPRAAPNLSPAPILESIEPPVETRIDIRPLLVSFFKNLDKEIKKHPTDASKIEAWIKSQISRPDYYYYFFCARMVLYDFYLENTPDHEKICEIFKRCRESLINLGLQDYLKETPSREFWVLMQKEQDELKDEYKERCKACLFVLRPLSEMLKQLPLESKEAQCHAIKTWFTQFKTKHLTYKNPFFFAPSLIYIRSFLVGMLNEDELRELEQLHEDCRKKLRELKLDEYIEERPADPTTEQGKLRNQLIREIWFFRALCSQKDLATLVTWLQENSPKADYPLLWGRQRSLHLENYGDGIDPIILRAWKHDFSECQTRLCAYRLQSHLHIDEIPEDASFQLRSFLVSDLCNEIQAAIKNPSDASSLVLTQHLRFYLKKYSSIVQRLIPSDLLSQWKEAFSAVPEETPPPPAADTIKAGTQFYRDLSDKHTKEGNESAQHWLDEKKVQANYAFPFFHSLYWQTLANSEPNLTLTVHLASHKKIVQWAYINNQGAQLFETPTSLSQGLCQLVHRLSEDLVLFEIKPETPVPEKAPPPLHPLLVHNVDKEAFKSVISEIAPHMAPLLEKPEMFLYWKNTLLDCAVFFCLDTMAIYQQARRKQSKKEVLTYFTTLKSRPDCEDKVTLFSRDHTSTFEKLAPLLPKDLAKNWRNKYGKFWKFLRVHEIQDSSYIDVNASPFFAQSALTFKAQFQDVLAFFEALENLKDNNLEIIKWTTQFSHLHPFWFAREFDNLSAGYAVKETDLGPGKIKKLKKLFEQSKLQLNKLKLEYFLTEAAPTRNLRLLKQVIDLIPPENS